ncbi:MAG: lipoate--protein ligase family protein [Chitinispirillaceae bacterium]|jgi:lipoate-protein ligase A|nr:lipoate--protein ligase family protein [Chitinispirillaceae bacterium]
MKTTIRIILDYPQAPEFNMAADNYLLDQAGSDSPVVVRIYSWDQPTISYGCLQNADKIFDKEAMKRHRIASVRRLTGGRAVLHGDDITYACIFPRSVRAMGGSIHETYEIISGCLIRGLALAGIVCETHDSCIEYAATKRNLTLPCFLSPNRNEIMVSGRKLVGSAQKRTAGAVLQHGSIPLGTLFRRLPEFLALDETGRRQQQEMVVKKCACVNELVKNIMPDKLAGYLIEGFVETLPFYAREKPWQEHELREIKDMTAIYF